MTATAALSPNIPEILSDVVDEVRYQNAAVDAKSLPDGTDRRLAQAALVTEVAVVAGTLSGKAGWIHALSVPFYRAASTVDNDETLRFELVKLAAGAVGWIEAIDKRNGK